MLWARAGASALLSLVVIAGVASAQVTIDSPGRYDVTVVAEPSFTPDGLPPLGPNAYPGELRLTRTGNSWHVAFQG